MLWAIAIFAAVSAYRAYVTAVETASAKALVQARLNGKAVTGAIEGALYTARAMAQMFAGAKSDRIAQPLSREQVVIMPDGTAEQTILGPDLRGGMIVQRLVPAGAWQGTRLVPGGRFALLGTTMTPGFDPGGFELASREDLADLDPGVRARAEPFLAPR